MGILAAMHRGYTPNQSRLHTQKFDRHPFGHVITPAIGQICSDPGTKRHPDGPTVGRLSSPSSATAAIWWPQIVGRSRLEGRSGTCDQEARRPPEKHTFSQIYSDPSCCYRAATGQLGAVAKGNALTVAVEKTVWCVTSGWCGGGRR